MKGNSSIKTVFGAFISILMFIQLANYSVIKFKVLKNKEDTSYSTVTQVNGLDPEILITQ